MYSVFRFGEFMLNFVRRKQMIFNGHTINLAPEHSDQEW
jgi:hypothetical protein